VNIFHEAVVAHPSSTLSLIYLGFTYLDANQIDKAMEVFQDLLKFDPNNLYAHMGMAKALSSLDVIDLSQAAASVEHSQFFWDSMVAASRREGIH
jgi:Tfp pilus assembly protein PilF